ncbi:phage integrase Arm DNA-binding domain-containing protein [Candidatus Hamiltonella endosymbiont of Tuberolachnus salignus]|uniref:phage integrase Arm DNA-binding domain-containing protein n=2 Tax=Candidatus Williamhamiltonella endosymbiont of Tuberolachnus salignus TaxID=3077954 RepID=UPI0030D35704
MTNQLLTPFCFESFVIRVVRINNEPWFIAQDVCCTLQIQNVTQAIERLDDDERSMFNIGRQGQANIISESGLYTLVLRCRDAVKKGTLPHRFRKWVTHEVLPQIRKTGQYIPEKYQPQSPEVFNGNDLNNLARLVWEMSHGFRFDNSWRHGIWSALRQVTGIPSPKPFQTRHIPLIAEECVRIFHLTNRFKDVVADTEKQVIRRVIRQREDADNVISEMNALLEAAAHHTEHTLASTLFMHKKPSWKKYMARKRKTANRDLPPNLYVRNNGYYCYRDPRTGKEYGLGKEKRMAINEAISANRQICDAPVSLTDRINEVKALSMTEWMEQFTKK